MNELEKALADIRLYEEEAELPAEKRIGGSAGNQELLQRAAEYREYLGFCREVDQALKERHINTYSALMVGKTPNLLVERIGLKQLPILLTPQHLIRLLRDHSLSLAQIKRIPWALARPEAVFDSMTRLDSIAVLLNMTDAEGAPIVASMRVNGLAKRKGKIISSNFLLSAYGKKDFMEWLNDQQECLLYWDKKRSNLPMDLRVPFPQALSNLASGDILRQSNTIVKPLPEKFSENPSWKFSPETFPEDLAFALRFIDRFTLREIAGIQEQAPNACYLATRAEYSAGLPDEKEIPLSQHAIRIRNGERPILVTAPGGILEYFDVRQTDASNAISSRLTKTARPDIKPGLVLKGLSMQLSGGVDPSLKAFAGAERLYLQDASSMSAENTDYSAFKAAVYAAGVELQLYGRLNAQSRMHLIEAAHLIKAADIMPEQIYTDVTVLLERARNDVTDLQRVGLEMARAEAAFMEYGRDEEFLKDQTQKEQEEAGPFVNPGLGL